MTLQLENIASGGVRLDLAELDFDAFVGRSLDELKRQPIRIDGRLSELGECFHVTGSAEDCRFIMCGDCGLVDGIGTRLKQGKIRIEGSVGSGLGRNMRGGLIDVCGNAGNFVGGPLRGFRSAMRGGEIVVRGNVGEFCGYRLRRGTILVLGSSGKGVGAEMVAGTIAIGLPCMDGLGVGMRRGTIVCLRRDGQIGERLVDKGLAGNFSAPHPMSNVFRRLLADRLVHLGDDELLLRATTDMTRVWQRLMGDRAVQGLGEIWFEGE